MLNKKVYNVICFEKEKVSLKDEWVECESIKSASFNPEKIYIHIASKRINFKYISLYIGLDICKLVGLKENDRIKILLSKENPYVIRLLKSNEGSLLTRSGRQKTTMRINKTAPAQLQFLQVTKPAKEVSFDFLNDNSIVLNLSEFTGRRTCGQD